MCARRYHMRGRVYREGGGWSCECCLMMACSVTGGGGYRHAHTTKCSTACTGQQTEVADGGWSGEGGGGCSTLECKAAHWSAHTVTHRAQHPAPPPPHQTHTTTTAATTAMQHTHTHTHTTLDIMIVCAHLHKEYHTRRHTSASIHPSTAFHRPHTHAPAHTRGVVM